MPNISGLWVCKRCKNCFSEAVGGTKHTPTKCPVCNETNIEPVFED